MTKPMGTGFLDFTETHQMRIEDTTFDCTVYGDSLTRLGQLAFERCLDYFGEQPFRIESLQAEEMRTVAGVLLHYKGRVSARAET